MFAIISVQHEDVMIMEKLDNETEVWTRKVSWAGLQPTLGKITQVMSNEPVLTNGHLNYHHTYAPIEQHIEVIV